MDSDDELQLLLVATVYLVHKRKKPGRVFGFGQFSKNGGSMENITNFSKKCD